MLVIAGDTATGARSNIQDIAQRDVILPTGAGFEQARTPDSALDDLAVAIRRAVTDQRPVVFNVPSDFMWADITYRHVELLLPELHQPHPDPIAVHYAAQRIATAERPVVLAGRGAIPARRSVLRLAERIGAPVATTLKAKDLFRSERFNLGIVGGLAGPATQRVLDDADLVVCFGASLNAYTTSNGELATKHRLIAVDSALPAALPYAATVIGDAAVVADALVSALDAAGAPPADHRTSAMARDLSRQTTPGLRPVTAPGTVDAETALRAIDKLLPQRRVLVCDGGRFMMEALRHIHVEDPRRFILPENFGSIGTGMGAAVGAAATRSPQPVVLLCGDGGFMHGGMAEFATAVRENLDLIVVVCNDGGYGAEQVQLADHGLDPSISLFTWPDLAAVADVLGGQGATVRCLDDLPAIAKLIAGRDRPLLIDLRLDIQHMAPMPH